MAADILAYKAQLVPVGVDQEPHLEIAREMARKFNREFDYDFPEPMIYKTKGAYVPSIAGDAKKMSKSVEGSYIALSDDLAVIQAKLAKAPTDAGTEAEMSQGTKNLFTLMEQFGTAEALADFKKQREDGVIRYGEFKRKLAEDIFAELGPIQERRRELEAKPGYVDEVLAAGAAKAQTIAEPILAEVKRLVGLS
jgi:tryptophanyl-tRNA synthetase